MSNFVNIAQGVLTAATAASQTIRGGGSQLTSALEIGNMLMQTATAILPSVNGEPVSAELQASRDELRNAIEARAEATAAKLDG